MNVEGAPLTVEEAVRVGAASLPASTTPRLDAQLLLAHVLGHQRPWVIAHPDARLLPEQSKVYRDLVSRRRHGVPVAYLRGELEWFGIDLAVTSQVLVPRPDTETLVEAALTTAREIDARTIADIGTGSGAIAVAMARGLPNARVLAVDRDHEALRVARQNVRRMHVQEQVELFSGDLLDPVDDRVDLIVANLPYLSDERMASLPADVRVEPRVALHGGPDGLDVYRRLIEQMKGRGLIVPMLIEIDPEQVDTAGSLLGTIFARVDVLPDLAGRPRVLAGR